MNHEITHSVKKNLFLNLKDKLIKHKFLSLAAFIIVVLLIAWQTSSAKSNKPVYQTAKVEKGTVISTVNVSGQVATAGTIAITSQASGIIKNIFVKNGDHVLSGQNLVEITPDQQSLQRQTQAYASYLMAKTTLDAANQTLFSLQSDMFTKWNTYMTLAQNSTYTNSDGSPNTVNRQLPLFYSPLDDWLSSEAKYKNQQGVIAQTQSAVSSNWAAYQAVSPLITAPVDGTVKDITLVDGMTVTTQLNNQGTAAVSQKIASIVTGNNAVAQFSLSEIDVDKVKEDQKATITLDALPGMTFTGHVIGVDTSGVVSSGVTNYPVTIQFDSPIAKILANMSATANIITATKDNALLVPTSAIQTQGGQSVVRILNKGQVQFVTVETGISSDSQTEITSGLSVGDDVITGTTGGSSSGARSVFSTGFGGGGGALRPGGFGGRGG